MAIFQIGLNRFSRLKKFKTLCSGHVISDLSRGEIGGTFNEKELLNRLI